MSKKDNRTVADIRRDELLRPFRERIVELVRDYNKLNDKSGKEIQKLERMVHKSIKYIDEAKGNMPDHMVWTGRPLPEMVKECVKHIKDLKVENEQLKAKIEQLREGATEDANKIIENLNTKQEQEHKIQSLEQDLKYRNEDCVRLAEENKKKQQELEELKNEKFYYELESKCEKCKAPIYCNDEGVSSCLLCENDKLQQQLDLTRNTKHVLYQEENRQLQQQLARYRELFNEFVSPTYMDLDLYQVLKKRLEQFEQDESGVKK